jgi:hypothetical protein
MNKEEEKLQSECYKWFHNSFPLERRMLFHVDNNSYNATIGAHKKALGVVKGVSDLVFIIDGSVIFIEMKTPSGEQETEQRDFEMKVKSRGHTYVVIRTFGMFKAYITNKLKQYNGS